MKQLYVLFEHASGYALFRVSEFEEIGILLPQVRRSIQDLGKFRSLVNFVAFLKFKSRSEALDNMIAVSKGQIHRDMLLFLESNIPKSTKNTIPIVIGVQDPELATVISNILGIECKTSGIIIEITRGIRKYFSKMVRGFANTESVLKSEMRLAFHFACKKLNITNERFDGVAIQTLAMLDQFEKDVHTSSKRVIHWYSLHFPELIQIVSDYSTYIKCVRVIKNRKEMPGNVENLLQEVLVNSDKVKNVLDAASTSMGMDIIPEDMENIEQFIDKVESLETRKNEMSEYLKNKMHAIAPNLSELMGEKVGAQLISQAGSLIKLANMPGSTVQVLGAKSALFRSLKSKNKSKFNTLNLFSYVGKANKSCTGPIAKYIANKCSIAARIDCFSEQPNNLHGNKLKQLVKDRAKFYATQKFASNKAIEEKSKALASKKALIRKRRKDKKKTLKEDLINHQQIVHNTQLPEKNLNKRRSSRLKINAD